MTCWKVNTIAVVSLLQGSGAVGGGGAFLPIAGSLANTSAAASSTPAPVAVASPAPASDAPAAAPVSAPVPAPGAAPTTAPGPSLSPSIRRALDTVNPLAANGEVDIEMSADFSSAYSVAYSLEKPDGSGSVALSNLVGTGGSFFFHTSTLAKVWLPKIASGHYVLRAKGQIIDMSTFTSSFVEATLPMELNALAPQLVSLSYNAGFVYRGSSRLLPLSYTSAVDGTLYVYPTGQASDTCVSKTTAELAAMPNVSTFTVQGSTDTWSQTYAQGSLFADADTACLQFVRSSDAMAEAPYTFNLRYQALSGSANQIFELGANAATVEKSALSLMSLPLSSNAIGVYDWLNRRELFTAGDIVQQGTSTSARIVLEQANGSWQYRLSAPVASDPPFFLANVECRPPLVFYVAH